MRKLVFLLLLLCSLDIQAGGSERSKEKDAESLMVKKSVQVLDARTGEPLIGADVHISGLDEVLYTDPEGFVEFECSADDLVHIDISYISYLDSQVELPSGLGFQAVNLLSR